MYAGKLRLVSINPGADIIEAEVRPPKGTEWLVITGGCSHGDIALRNLSWTWRDDDLDIEYTTKDQSIGLGGFSYPISGDFINTSYTYFMSPIILRNSFYAVAKVSALTAGKAISVNIHVIERPENFELQVLEMFANYMGYKLPISSRE